MGRRVSFTVFQKRAEEVGGRAGNRTAWLKALVSVCLGVRAMSAAVLPRGDPGAVSPLLLVERDDHVPGSVLSALCIFFHLKITTTR